jgi:hypothetical protein
MSGPDTSRWPNLQGRAHPTLDWHVTEYTAARLIEMADAVSKNPHPIQTRTATGEPGVWDPAIETVLRAVAADHKALAALNHKVKLIPADIVGRNRAVHCRVLALVKRTKAEERDAYVAKIWGTSPGQIRKDLGNHDDAGHVVEQLINAVCVVRRRERADVLKDLNADMHYRAGIMGAQRKKSRRKKSRK